jgi:uncharacterized protein
MPENRFVLDTNTVLSAIIWQDSIPAKAVEKALLEGVVLISQETEDEFVQTISRSKFDKLKPPEQRFSELTAFLQKCQRVQVSLEIHACRDPKDDKFLALAKEGDAVLIVSGDKDLLEMTP